MLSGTSSYQTSLSASVELEPSRTTPSSSKLINEATINELSKFCETLEFENSVFERFYVRENCCVKMSDGDSRAARGKKSSLIAPPSADELALWVAHIEHKSQHVAASGNMLANMAQVVGAVLQTSCNDGSSASKNSSTDVAQQQQPQQKIPFLNRLTSENKCDVVLNELDEVERDMNHTREESDKSITALRCRHELLDLKNRDHAKSHADFEREMRDFERDMRSHGAKRLQAEKIQRFFDEKKRAKESLIKKIRLKTSTNMTKIKKVATLLQQKEEMGGVLHKVDLEQLKFENEQYSERIEATNKALLDLKQKATTTSSHLNDKKDQIKRLSVAADVRAKEIVTRSEAKETLDQETALVHEEVCALKANIADHETMLQSFQVPSTMSYILEKSRLDELRARNKSWVRKVEISQMKLKSLKSRWGVLCRKAKAAKK